MATFSVKYNTFEIIKRICNRKNIDTTALLLLIDAENFFNQDHKDPVFNNNNFDAYYDYTEMLLNIYTYDDAFAELIKKILNDNTKGA